MPFSVEIEEHGKHRKVVLSFVDEEDEDDEYEQR